ncbi:MAG: 9 hemes c containing cytochrome [Elusimicrobia bacterium]|nr:MAG: 9 hemes c containing cytochrome [Elusimicrobiota bacterium]
MARPWEKKGFHACATCHTAHAVKKPSTALLAGDGALCARCHKPESKGMLAAGAMKAELDGTTAAYESAEAAIGSAEEKGMDMADARDSLSAAKMAMYQAHTAVHSFDPGTVAKTAGESKSAAAKALEAARAAVQDFRNRRLGLGLSTFVIAFLAGALYLKLRDYESGE